jgi:hypothetical protein
MAHSLYQVGVKLSNIEPPIWRTLELAGASTLEDLHFAIQVAMGWQNCHLHQFIIGRVAYGMAGVEDMQLEDEREFHLEDVAKEGAAFKYEYDFGDGWEHEITIEKVTAVKKAPVPRCIAGARACPPEDSGGPHGYELVLAALANPAKPAHRERAEWAGDFAPERFSLPKGGHLLQGEMAGLEELANQDREDDPTALPRPLVEAVLALDPMRRASLSALIAGSLANEIGQLLETLAKAAPKRRHR